MGIAASIMLIFIGYPLGIAGFFRECISPIPNDRFMRIAFVAGSFGASLFFRFYQVCVVCLCVLAPPPFKPARRNAANIHS